MDWQTVALFVAAVIGFRLILRRASPPAPSDYILSARWERDNGWRFYRGRRADCPWEKPTSKEDQ